MRIAIIFLVLALIGCQQVDTDVKEPMQEVTGGHVQDLEKTACTAADEAGTCATRLASLGFITKEQCCQKYQKCC